MMGYDLTVLVLFCLLDLEIRYNLGLFVQDVAQMVSQFVPHELVLPAYVGYCSEMAIYDNENIFLITKNVSLSFPYLSFFYSAGLEGWLITCLLINTQIVASPADLIKVRMQADSRMVILGLKPRYLGPFDALSKIISKEGFGGLWKGVAPNVQRAFLVNMGELACYDHAKHFVIQNQIAEDNIYAHTLSSSMSGLSATLLSCPADVVKTRMMNEATSEKGKVKYKNSVDCLVKTVRIEGVRALWKGFFPTWARLGPWQFVFWVSYEKCRQIVGISSF